jgi:hypothetical protein
VKAVAGNVLLALLAVPYIVAIAIDAITIGALIALGILASSGSVLARAWASLPEHTYVSITRDDAASESLQSRHRRLP